jgi:hypothetical protein
MPPPPAPPAPAPPAPLALVLAPRKVILPPSLRALPAPPAPLVPMNNIYFLKREIDVVSNDICYRGVHCFYEDCSLIHFPIHKCNHKNNCDRNMRDKSCGFIHDQHESVMNRLEDNKFELYKGWEQYQPIWAKTVEGRAAHFKRDVIKSTKFNHNVCIDWIMTKCDDVYCNRNHYIPSSYKVHQCENYKSQKCDFPSKYCNDIHGINDIILWRIERRSRSRSRSRSRGKY